MDKILRAVDVSVWFAHQGWFHPSTCHIGQEINEGDTIRYICKCDDDDEWEYSYKTFIFNKRDMRWYLES